MLGERDLFWCYIRRECIFNILFSLLRISVSQNLRMSYVNSNGLNALIYSGTVMLSGLLYATYYFGHNVVWKQDLRNAKEDIITQHAVQTEGSKLEILKTVKEDVNKVNQRVETMQGDLKTVKEDVNKVNQRVETVQGHLKKTLERLQITIPKINQHVESDMKKIRL